MSVSHSHGSVARSVRLNKDNRPQDYCPNIQCLWNVRLSGPCRRHMRKPTGRKRCQNCGDYEDIVGYESTCTTFEKDAGNPFGRIPILGAHEWFEEKA